MKKPKKSLRNIILLWLLLFSIVPIAFVTGYSRVVYEQSINDELKKRLDVNSRQINSFIKEAHDLLISLTKAHASDPSFILEVASGSLNKARKMAETWLKTSAVQRVSVFDPEGRLIVSMQKGADNRVEQLKLLEVGDIYLSPEILNQLKEHNDYLVREVNRNKNVELVYYSKLISKRGRLVGYIEEILVITSSYLQSVKKRLGLEVAILNPEGQVAISSHGDLHKYNSNFYKKALNDNFFDLTLHEQPFGFLIQPLASSEGSMLLAVGTSKLDSKNVLQRITVALFTITLIVILLLIPILFWISKIILNPLEHLVSATQKIESGESIKEIPVESDNEIGILTQSFNRMFNRVAQARKELEAKIVELEKINQELQNTQAQLIHQSKMVSLGQLVAGVAHELNNPIGFIYSNMEHLRDYSEKLLKVIEVAENNPKKLSQVKKEVEFDYIVNDLPKLIKSCEDGTRRTRDIVLGLRNFSRLDEAILKEIDLQESINNTLTLLSGELKSRIKVHTDFGNIKPLTCYASQINQVFMNILTNAAQSIPDKGEIWIKTYADEKFAHISIKDSGTGIPEAVLEKIFDPFFTTKPVGQGTGLGLSISYGIIKKHGGNIQVNSTPGKGTEFIISLPWVLKS